MDHASASAGGLIYGDRLKTVSRIDPEDAMLAGIAKVHRETVISRNVRHFKGIGVTVESYYVRHGLRGSRFVSDEVSQV